ncbi:Winged helix DNA-binding domain-containing protein [Chitinophaga sp. CF118]|uniref:winged helix DNA-binding domain-containing protein n=1 Tax=Chitinophaga sp. CF118 TaxID=1884367 RepID=UPI0008E54910|nr:winged helix DNA-binding domain-containing protein [Chitinophaga sp. CF118]SFD78447.1 Winged helix DNA-binding domain-containing protein [Chitinophaga sp. CF118]
MTSRTIAHHRLINQQITGADFSEPDELIRWMGCIQAQDFAAAKWAIGNRINGITEAEIDRQFNDGIILRTHILRPTWHFVSPEDIGWILKLSAPKIKVFNKTLHRKLGIDENTLTRSKHIIAKALMDGKQLTREQLIVLLKKGKINTDDIRSNFLMMDAELDGMICSGARHGKQFTYALLEERVPDTHVMDHEAAIAELTKRYFLSRGPATLQDFTWWSKLNLSEAKMGIEMNKKLLAHEVINGQAYWFSSDMDLRQKPKNSLHLLPAFDEYTVAYKDRSDILKPAYHKQSGNGIFKPVIMLNGQIAGTWKRTEYKSKVLLETYPFSAKDQLPEQLIKKAAEKYARFVEKELVEAN